MTQRNGDRAGRLGVAGGMIFAALLLLAYAVLIVFHARPPLLGDLPSWDVASLIVAHHMRGLPDAFHSLKSYPVPNSAIAVVPGLLMLLVSPELASRLFLLLYLVLVFLAVRSVLRAAGADPVMWWIVPAGCFLSLNFWWGSLGFLLGLVLLLFFLSALIRREGGGEREGVLGLLLCALFLTHMVPYTFALLLLVLFAIQYGRWRVLWQAAPSAALLLWYVVGRFTSGNVDAAAAPTSMAHLYGATFWAQKINAFLKTFGLVNPVTLDLQHSAAHALLGTTGFLLLLTINLLLCGAVLVFLIKRGIEAAVVRPYVWLSVALAVPAYLLVPMSLLGISDPGSRILQTAVFPLLLVMPVASRRSRSLVVIAACSVALAVGNLALFARLAWATDVPQRNATLPVRLETLARVPYSDMAPFLTLLHSDDTSTPVFETSVVRNRK